MADEKRVVRTAGISGTLRMPGLLETEDGPADLDITPEGVEVTREQWLVIAKAATDNHVVVRLDEDFPFVSPEASAPETESTPPPAGDTMSAPGATEETKTDDSGPEATGSSTPMGGRSARKGS